MATENKWIEKLKSLSGFNTVMSSVPVLVREGGTFKDFLQATGEALRQNPVSTPFQLAGCALMTTGTAVASLGICTIALSAAVMAPVAALGAMGIGAGPSLAVLAAGGLGLAGGAGGAIVALGLSPYYMPEALEKKYDAAYIKIDEKNEQQAALKAHKDFENESRLALQSNAPAPQQELTGISLKSAFASSAPRGIANEAPAVTAPATPRNTNTLRHG